MRILQIHPYLRSEAVNPRAGGKTRTSIMISRYLLRNGHEVGVYSWPERIWGNALPFLAAEGRTALAYPTLALPSFARLLVDSPRLASASFSKKKNRSPLTDLLFLQGLRSAIDRFRPDMIHNHQTGSDIPALYRLLGRPVPMLLFHHSGSYDSQMRMYDRVLFPAKWLMEEACKAVGYPQEKARYVHYPVSDIFRGGTICPEEERDGLVFVGGVTTAKGIDILLDTIAQNTDLRRETIRVCGSLPSAGEFLERAERLGLPVVFEGKLEGEKLRTAVSHARLLVNPSRLEGFSIALLEALACGTPVIGWAPQVREIESLWGRKVGYPFDGRTQKAQDLADILRAAWKSPLLRTPEREEIARLARAAFSADRFGSEYVRYAGQVLGLG